MHPIYEYAKTQNNNVFHDLNASTIDCNKKPTVQHHIILFGILDNNMWI